MMPRRSSTLFRRRLQFSGSRDVDEILVQRAFVLDVGDQQSGRERPPRTGRGVRQRAKVGGRSRPGTDVDRPRGGPRRHKAPPTSGRSGTRMSVLRDRLRMRFFGSFQLSCDSRVPLSAQ